MSIAVVLHENEDNSSDETNFFLRRATAALIRKAGPNGTAVQPLSIPWQAIARFPTQERYLQEFRLPPKVPKSVHWQ